MQGIIGFPVTPRDVDLAPDETALRVHVESLLASGLKAIAYFGSNGELYALTLDNYARICELARDLVARRRFLIFGVGQSGRTAARHAAMARRAGASAVLCMVPYTADPNEPGLADDYRRIADDAALTIILYQTKWSGVLPCSLLKRRADVENIRMVKHESGNLSHHFNVRRQCGDRFRWLDRMAEPFVFRYWKLGVETFGSALACFMPQVPLRVRDLAQQGNFQAINRILATLVLPTDELRNRRPSDRVSMIMTAMSLAGLPVGGVRPPLNPMEPAGRDDLRKLMARNGLLSSEIAA